MTDTTPERPTENTVIISADATSLYRYFDSRGVLLYVGITSRGIIRNIEHATTKEWWRYVASQTVEHFQTREEALVAERAAIESLTPPFNVQNNPAHAESREQYFAGLAADKAAESRTTPGSSGSMAERARSYAEAGMKVCGTIPGVGTVSIRTSYTDDDGKRKHAHETLPLQCWAIVSRPHRDGTQIEPMWISPDDGVCVGWATYAPCPVKGWDGYGSRIATVADMPPPEPYACRCSAHVAGSRPPYEKSSIRY